MAKDSMARDVYPTPSGCESPQLYCIEFRAGDVACERYRGGDRITATDNAEQIWRCRDNGSRIHCPVLWTLNKEEVEECQSKS
ncbi:hypothetical protein [Vibrio proteolyticus]